MAALKRPGNVSNNNVGKSNRQMSKQNRGRQDGFFQQFSAAYDSQFSQSQFEPSSGYTSYQFQNPAYNNQRPQYQSFVEESASSALAALKQPLRITFGSGSDSRNQSDKNQTGQNQKSKPAASGERFGNRVKQTYMMDEADEEVEEGFQEQQEEEHGEYHVADENLDYYNTEEGFHEEEASVNLTFEIAKDSFPRCRRCRKTFPFNNSLHRHLRNECSVQNYSADVSASQPVAAASPTGRPPPPSFTGAIKGSANTSTASSVIIHSDVDASADIDTGYGFRG